MAFALEKNNCHSKLLSFINNEINDCHGGKLYHDIEDNRSGKLMFNIGMASFNTDSQEIAIDARIPLSFDDKSILERIQPLLNKYDLNIEIVDYQPALDVSEDSFIVSKLMQAYNDVTCDDTKPKTTGGATFSRLFNNMVAFGARLNNAPTLAHQANERVLISSHKQAFDIYIKAFELLCF
jgi:acetylornithine deacetylase/succinyl-diaminopimelate desuccinylase-like protein